MSVPSYPFHSLPLKLLNKGINFSFPPLKLLNKGREEYSKIIIFIHFHSIPFPPKRDLSKSNTVSNFVQVTVLLCLHYIVRWFANTLTLEFS